VVDGKKVTRRDFLVGALVTGGSLAAGGAAWWLFRNKAGRNYDRARSEAFLAKITPNDQYDQMPNIVVILVDDLGYGDLGVYGGKTLHTPNLERVAEEGVVLTNFYATASVCTPSRAGLLTGRYPIRTHMTTPLYPTGHPMYYFLNIVGRYPYNITGIPEDEVMLPEVLHRRGYRTGMVGKWHLGDRSPHLPTENGFESFYGPLYSNDVTPFAIYRDKQVEIEAPADQNELTRNYTREATEFIERNQAEPFFLYLSHSMVHEPIHASGEFRGRSESGLYGDAVEELDWSVGEILKTLGDLGLDEKTLVMFTSDNGPWWQGSAGSLRGRKNNLMEGGFRVPFLARWPGVLPTGIESEALSANFDIFATCLEIAGIPLPVDRIIDGKSMMPILKADGTTTHEMLFYYDGNDLVAIRDGDFKYHRRHMSENGGYPLFNHGPFLFNLASDPNESYNLTESEPEMAERLAGMLDAWEEEVAGNLRGWLPSG
jgi:arylsulfatase A